MTLRRQPPRCQRPRRQPPGCRLRAVHWALAAGLGLLGTLAAPGGAQADTDAADAGTPQILTGRLSDLPAITHEIASGRRISPIGTLAGTPNFAAAVALSGARAYVLSSGATRAQSVTAYRAADLQRLGAVEGYRQTVPGEAAAAGVLRIARQDFFQGLATGPDGRVYAAGGASDVLLALRPTATGLAELQRYRLAFHPFPADQYPYRYQGSRGSAYHFYPDGVALDHTGRHAYVTGLLSNAVARIDLATGATQYANAGPYPFAPVLADHGRRLVVSDWGGCGVRVFDAASLKPLGRVCLGPRTGPDNADPGIHPTALAVVPDTADVVFAAANLDAAVEVDTRSLKVVRRFDDAPYPGAPPGSYPDAVAVHGGRLYVANAGNNDVAVFDLASGRRLGLIPTAWYPTALAAGPDALYIAAAKGLGSGPNLKHQWVGNMMHGAVQRIAYARLDAELPRLTATALADNGFAPAERAALERANRKTTAWLRRHIRTVVFILRENKTFDEELGRYRPAGRWADPKLALYGPRQLPNLYAWADRYALFDNFYADGEVTAQGHQWVTGASDSDFVQRTWPQYYSGRGLVPNPGWTQSLVPAKLADGTGGIPGGEADPYAIYTNLSKLGKWSNPWIAYPERLYLFNSLLAHHVDFEDFGEFVSRNEAGVIAPAMRAHLAVDFPGWDRMILDTQRARVAVDWMRGHARDLPRFMYLWLPDDHTAGSSPCYYTPDYYVADNDQATARIVHYLSTTPQWKHMLVIVTEDDAQSGADHIDAHRTFAVALGPWVRHVQVTRRYSQVNLVRTIEAVLDLPPMSQWDANAAVIDGIWRAHPDDAPVPVQPLRTPVAYNAGSCPDGKLLRRIAGASGQTVTAAWLRAHLRETGTPPPQADDSYTPTSLLKVPGPEQMRQEWAATYGQAGYRRVMAYLRQLAHQQHAPLSHFLANEDDDD